MKPLEAAVSLARSHGIAVDEPVVLRDLSNLLVHLRPSPVVARVATTTAAARGGGLDWLAREIDVAAFLVSRGAPVVPPAGELPPGPHLHEGWAITFWGHVEHDGTASGAEVGEALLALHEALAPYPGELPGLADVLDEVEGLIGRVSEGFRAGEPERLRDALARVRGELAGAGLEARALHGDAHRHARDPRDEGRTPTGNAEGDAVEMVQGVDVELPHPGPRARLAHESVERVRLPVPVHVRGFSTFAVCGVLRGESKKSPIARSRPSRTTRTDPGSCRC
jgi:hypothetical protein